MPGAVEGTLSCTAGILCTGIGGTSWKTGKRKDYLFLYAKRGDQVMKWLIYYLIVVNLLTWLIYGIDKWKAKRRVWRIPERTLLFLAAAGGCTGALAGMLMFRHKTRKLRFMVGVPVIFVVESIFFTYIFLKL